MQKRLASSIFITLAPPRRELYAKMEARRPEDPVLSSSHRLTREARAPPGGPFPCQASGGANLRSKGRCPGDPDTPNGAPPSLTLNGADEKQTATKVENTVSTEICAFCHKAIPARAPTLEAMNKQYHADCFMCRTCQHPLAGERYYQKDGRPLCAACYQNTLEKCAMCQALILTQIVRAMGHSYHPECFTCVTCARAIGDETFALDESDQVYCLDDFYRKFASVCGACENPIVPSEGRDSYRIECLGRTFHEECYRCERCRVLLSPEPTEDGCYPLGGCLLCKFCHIQQTQKPLLLSK